MIKIEHGRFLPKSTIECVSLLNIHIGEEEWKRVSKFELNIKAYSNFTLTTGKNYVRVFTDGSRFVTIITSPSDRESRIYPDMNLSEHLTLIRTIEKVATKFYTWDYGKVFYDPYKKRIFIVGGDSGYGYSKLPKSTIKQLEEEGELSYEDLKDIPFESFPGLEEITSCDWEAEAEPNDEEGEEEQNYIYITDVNDICDL